MKLDAKPARSRRSSPPAAIVALLGATGLSGCGKDAPVAGNHPPVIARVVAIPSAVTPRGRVQVTALASDADGDSLVYSWRASGGVLGTPGSEGRVLWTAPETSGAYRIAVTASDGQAATSDSVVVSVGAATLHVESDPSGIAIRLDGIFVGSVTPADLTVIPGEYEVSISDLDLLFAPEDTFLTVAEGGSGTARFRLPPVRTEYVDTGPSTVDEIGGVVYTRLGLGLVYGARKGSETTLRTASLTPGHLGTNGRVLLGNLNWEEPMSLRRTPAGAELAFIRSDSLHVGSLIDTDQDGLMESLTGLHTFAGLTVRTYAPSFNPTGDRLAFALQPSTQPNTRDTTLVTDYIGGVLTNPVDLSSIGGNSASLGPNDVAVFESGGEIYVVTVPTSGFPYEPILLTQTGRHARAPVISPNGRVTAWIDDRGRLMLTLIDRKLSLPILEGVSSARVAWNPQINELAIADHATPGDARLRLVTRLPLEP